MKYKYFENIASFPLLFYALLIDLIYSNMH